MDRWSVQFRNHIKRRRDFIITVGIAVIAVAIYYPFSPAAVQARNMAKARAHIPVIRLALGSDARFSRLRFRDFTAHYGSLYIGGSVPTRADLNRLKEIVASTSPPTAVIFGVVADSEINATQPAESD